MTHADTVSAVGKPPDRVESPATGGALGDTDTHERLSVPPGSIQENDIYRAGPGDFRTVAQRVELGHDYWSLRFRHPHEGPGNSVALDGSKVPKVIVYRPRSVAA